MKKSVTAVFDIGKTNKKFFLFDKKFREVHRSYAKFSEIRDEDSYPTDDLNAISSWIKSTFDTFIHSDKFEIKALNFSTYGASLVHMDENGNVLTPLYNYTKPFPEQLLKRFYETYGTADIIAKETASPSLAMLNSGLQLYFLKYARPDVFSRIAYSLHFPQYLSYLFTGIPIAEYTSIGCHTALWNFGKQDYHEWVYAEELDNLLPPIVKSDTYMLVSHNGRKLKVGVGIHDSSSALIPYLKAEKKPFLLLSTGTWSICLNPFSEDPLTDHMLTHDCLNFMRQNGKTVRASRLFLGNEYKIQVQQLCQFFGKPQGYQKSIQFDPDIISQIVQSESDKFHLESIQIEREQPDSTNLSMFDSFEHAYHQLLVELTRLQVFSLQLAAGTTKIKKIYIDGGFANNDIYVKLLTHYLPTYKIRTTQASLGSALGAAMVVSDQRVRDKFLNKNYGLIKHHKDWLDNPRQKSSEN